MSGGRHVRRNDNVKVLSGKDKGKTGRVRRVLPDEGRAVVESVNFIKEHVKANPSKGIQGGVLEKEAPIHLAKLQVICPECNKPTRVGHKFLETGQKIRVCRACSGMIDKA